MNLVGHTRNMKIAARDVRNLRLGIRWSRAKIGSHGMIWERDLMFGSFFPE